MLRSQKQLKKTGKVPIETIQTVYSYTILRLNLKIASSPKWIGSNSIHENVISSSNKLKDYIHVKHGIQFTCWTNFQLHSLKLVDLNYKSYKCLKLRNCTQMIFYFEISSNQFIFVLKSCRLQSLRFEVWQSIKVENDKSDDQFSE